MGDDFLCGISEDDPRLDSPYVQAAYKAEPSPRDLKVRLHAELTSVVRNDVTAGKPGAMEFANLCKQVGVSLDNGQIA